MGMESKRVFINLLVNPVNFCFEHNRANVQNEN